MMPNAPDAEITINGETHPLRLTLGALAQIETALGGGDFDALQASLAKPSVSDMITILHALLMGGGAQMPLAVLKASDVDLALAANAIATAFSALDTQHASPQEAPGKLQASKTKPEKTET